MMFADTLDALGLKRGDYVVKVNSRKVLDGVLDTAGVDPRANAAPYFAQSTSSTGLGSTGVRALLGAGRKDESGDFTKGAGLSNSRSRHTQFHGLGATRFELGKHVASNDVAREFRDRRRGSRSAKQALKNLHSDQAHLRSVRLWRRSHS